MDTGSSIVRGDLTVTGNLKTISGTLSVTTGSWSSGTYGPYARRATVPIGGVNANHTPIVAYDLASKANAADANCSHVESFDGGIYLYADKTPASTLTFNYKMV